MVSAVSLLLGMFRKGRAIAVAWPFHLSGFGARAVASATVHAAARSDVLETSRAAIHASKSAIR